MRQKLKQRAQAERLTSFSSPDVAQQMIRPTSRNDLNGAMKNARVESRQFHSMFFSQFGKIQIGKLSARLRGDSLG
jgi:hypothetical protein